MHICGDTSSLYKLTHKCVSLYQEEVSVCAVRTWDAEEYDMVYTPQSDQLIPNSLSKGFQCCCTIQRALSQDHMCEACSLKQEAIHIFLMSSFNP